MPMEAVQVYLEFWSIESSKSLFLSPTSEGNTGAYYKLAAETFVLGDDFKAGNSMKFL